MKELNLFLDSCEVENKQGGSEVVDSIGWFASCQDGLCFQFVPWQFKNNIDYMVNLL